MQTLETERLILRSWTEDDLDDFYAYAKNPNVGPHAGWAPHTDKTISHVILQSFIKKDDVWAIVEKACGRAIGSLGLHADSKRSNGRARMIGYVLREESWGNGIRRNRCGAYCSAPLRRWTWTWSRFSIIPSTIGPNA